MLSRKMGGNLMEEQLLAKVAKSLSASSMCSNAFFNIDIPSVFLMHRAKIDVSVGFAVGISASSTIKPIKPLLFEAGIPATANLWHVIKTCLLFCQVFSKPL